MNQSETWTCGAAPGGGMGIPGWGHSDPMQEKGRSGLMCECLDITPGASAGCGTLSGTFEDTAVKHLLTRLRE